MSQRKRKSRSNRNPRTARRRSRRKASTLMAAIVIEAISAIALVSAYRFAQDVRQSNRQLQSHPSAEASMSTSALGLRPSSQPIFRVPDLAAFKLGDS